MRNGLSYPKIKVTFYKIVQAILISWQATSLKRLNGKTWKKKNALKVSVWFQDDSSEMFLVTLSSKTSCLIWYFTEMFFVWTSIKFIQARIEKHMFNSVKAFRGLLDNKLHRNISFVKIDLFVFPLLTICLELQGFIDWSYYMYCNKFMVLFFHKLLKNTRLQYSGQVGKIGSL